MTIPDLETLLRGVCSDTYYLAAPSGMRRYVVYQPLTAGTHSADDRTSLSTLRVQIDLRYVSKSDTLPRDVCVALERAYIPYTVEDIGYEDESGRMRCIIRAEVWDNG
mgnify:CR=1 FL=1